MAAPLHSQRALRYSESMRITFTKGIKKDLIGIDYDDGRALSFDFPKKGPTPHDAYHYFVERELGFKKGFWGLVAAGMDPAHVGQLAADCGHVSAKRAQVPDAEIVELLQAERLVECFEAESWSGGDDNDGIMSMAEPGWLASHVPAPAGVRERLGEIRRELAAFAGRWQELKQGESVSLEWE